MKKILIISAMADAELNYLLERIQNKQEKTEKICKFYEGKIGENEVVLCESKVGLINASAATTLAIEKYNPDYIINQGCAGGYGTVVHRSDIVVGVECINITSIRTQFKDKGEGSDIKGWELINYVSGEQDRLIPQPAGKKLIEIIRNNENLYSDGNIHYGVIASGDIWNKEYDRICFLNKEYAMLCEDMEGVAVCTIANRYNIPSIDIRVISNNEILGESYDKSVCGRLQMFIEKIIKKM